MNYKEDPTFLRCIEQIKDSKAKIGFGAVLLNGKDEEVGWGKNRHSKEGEYQLLDGGVDYAIHAEGASLIVPLKKRIDISGFKLYVVGIKLSGSEKGYASIRKSDNDIYFSCIRCAKMFNRFDICVHIPLPSGWFCLSPQEALRTAQKRKDSGKRLGFAPFFETEELKMYLN